MKNSAHKLWKMTRGMHKLVLHSFSSTIIDEQQQKRYISKYKFLDSLKPF